MDVLTQLLSLENIVLCLAISALVWIQRKLMELLIPALTKKGSKANKWWEEFLVPIGPIGSGALLMLIPYLPAPEMFSENMGSRFVFGIGLGLISGLIYRLVKKNLLDKLNKSENEQV